MVDQLENLSQLREEQLRLLIGAPATELGQSGTGAGWRSGVQRLAEGVAQGRVGAVFALEVSRLTRSSADWHRLLELCGLADVVIVDEQAVDTPRDYNDRLLLGLKGQMSEAEQYWMRCAWKVNKARRGEALFVLWIPFLLMISISRASYNLAERASASSRLGMTPSAAGPPSSAANCMRASLDSRDRRILAEDRAFFVPRLCFGALLVLGMSYVFAPFGLKASYLMSLVADHALPGHTSFMLWCNNFSATPVIVVGFVGFLIYALITASQRCAQDDLDDQAIFSLLVRGLVVILLSFALSSSPMNTEVARLFVFVAGVFPIRALEAIAKRGTSPSIQTFRQGTTSKKRGLGGPQQ